MAEIRLTDAQRAVVSHRGGALLVSAAAGSGKTKVLTERLLSYVTDEKDPKNIDDFLIITYTNAAASELRGKILAALQERLADHPGDRRLQRQITRLYLADISTVHAFCGRILREYAYLLDIPADFRNADEAECAPLKEKAMQTALSACYANLSDDFRAYIDQIGFGRDDRKAIETAQLLYEKAQTHRDPDAWLSHCSEELALPESADFRRTVWGGILFDRTMQFLDDRITQFEKALRIIRDDPGLELPYTEAFRSLLDEMKRLRASESWDEIHMHGEFSVQPLGRAKKDADPASKELVQHIRKKCVEELKKELKPYSISSKEAFEEIERIRPAARGAAELVRAFSASYKKEKRMRHLLDFSDLEHEAIRLLCGSSGSAPTAAARQIAARYREVMVDEYQDSNGIQDLIFSAVSDGGKKLFMVGDVKQSIYRFRLADPGIFLEKYRRFSEDPKQSEELGRKIILSENFRSRPEILSCANDVFRRAMSVRTGDLNYGDAESLKPGGIPFPEVSTPLIELHCIDEDLEEDKDGQKEDKTEIEAAFTAKRISELFSGGACVTENGSLRGVRPDDIAILLRSPGTSAETYISALKKLGIPCVNESERNTLDMTELQVMISFLRIVQNPHQDIPLVSVLASPLFCFSATELARIRGTDRNGDIYDALCASKSEKATAFLKLLNSLRDLLQDEGVPAVLERMILETDAMYVFGAMEEGDCRVSNLRTLSALAVSHAQNGGTLSSFLHMLDSRNGKSIDQTEKTSAGAVRLTSIHKSKGLEYPIVFLCGLSKKFNNTDLDQSVLMHPELGIACSVLDRKNRIRYSSAAKNAVREKLKREMISEEMRVLYVAMTRAKEMLIMTYAEKNLPARLSDRANLIAASDDAYMAASASCHGHWILNEALHRAESGNLLASVPFDRAVSEHPWRMELHGASELLSSGKTVCFSGNRETLHSLDLSEYEREAAFEYPYRRSSSVPSKLTATQLKGRMLDQEISEFSLLSPARPYRTKKPSFLSEERSLSAAEVGTAVHLAMQFIDFSRCSDRTGILAELERLREEEFLTKEQTEAIDPVVIIRFFESELGKRVLNADSIKREFKFSVLVDADESGTDKILLQGVTDCCISEEDGIAVLDFKTDRVTEENEPERAEYYRGQLESYSLALSRIFGKPVKEKILYFFFTGHAVSL